MQSHGSDSRSPHASRVSLYQCSLAAVMCVPLRSARLSPVMHVSPAAPIRSAPCRFTTLPWRCMQAVWPHDSGRLARRFHYKAATGLPSQACCRGTRIDASGSKTTSRKRARPHSGCGWRRGVAASLAWASRGGAVSAKRIELQAAIEKREEVCISI